MNAENMRVRVTKRMLREGLLRCLKHTSIDKLSVSELCRESGVNRATFYNHYEIPKDILMEIGMEYADEIKRIFESSTKLPISEKLAHCLEVLYNNKETIKIIYGSGSDQHLTNVSSDIFMWIWGQVGDIVKKLNLKHDADYELVAYAMGMGVYNLVKIWLTEDVDRTPSEIADILLMLTKKIFL